MNISDAIKIMGVKNKADLAKLLGITRQAVYQWPDDLPQATSDRVVGAAHRLGKVEVEDGAIA